ncbi:MAG: cytochrome c3 family protein [Bacteroidales bacterium]
MIQSRNNILNPGPGHINKIWLKLVFLFIFAIIAMANEKGFSQTITSAAAGGNWSATATWIGGVVPGPANDVVIASGSNNVTLNVNATCASLTIGIGATRGRLYHNTGMSLTVTGPVTLTQGSATDNRWRINAGSATVSGLISFTGASASAANFMVLTITTGTLNANGGILFTASAAATKEIDMSGGAGTINLKGALTVPAASSTLTPGTSSIFNYVDAANQTVNFFSAGSYFNLYLNNTGTTGATLSAAVTSTNVTGNISVGNTISGSLFNTNDFNMGMASSRTLTVSAGSTMKAGTSVITFPGTTGATINGTFITSNPAGFSGGATTAINSTNNPGITLAATSTIEYNAAATQTVTTRTYAGNVILTGLTKTIGTAASQTLTISKNLTINNGATYLGSTFNPILLIGGDFSNSGLFTQGTSLVTFNGTLAQNLTGSSATTFANNVTLSNTAGLNIATSPTINGTLTFANGKITTGVNRLILGSSAVISGAGAGKYVFGTVELFIPNAPAPAVTFPIGDATNYTPVLISFSGTTSGSGSIFAFTTPGDHPDILNSGINPSLSVNRNWTISQGAVPVGGFNFYNGTFTFINGTPIDLDAGANAGNFIISKLTGGSWESTSTGTRTTTSTQATGMTSFGTYQPGESSALVNVATHPANSTVCQGAAASFSSTSTSLPAPTIQWQRDPNNGTFENITAVLDGGVYTNFTGTTLNISNSTGLNGYLYRAVFTNVNGSATSNNAILTVTNLPAAAGSVTGSGSVCQGQSGVAYSTGAIAGATSYTWNYSGAGFTPSGTTSAITGSYSAAATSGNLIVTGVNSCGNGLSSPIFPVIVGLLPAAAGAITGSAVVCQGQSGVAYSIPAIAGATSYQWSYSGTGFTPSGNGSSISGTFSAGATSGNLTVTGFNSCGSGISSPNFVITVNTVPSAAGTITGTASVCRNQSGIAYSCPTVSGATSYLWSYSGTGFTPSGTTASITGSFSASATSGNLTVAGVNACGSGIASTTYPITVLTGVPGAAGTITGTPSVCQNQAGVAFSVPAISGATSYTWSYSGTGFTPSGNTASITGNFSITATSGNLVVSGVNACGTGIASAAFPIVVNPLPSAAGAISGTATVCQGQTAVPYSVTPVSGATGYSWTYTGTGFTPSGNTSSITGAFAASATSGNLRVAGTNACGTGTASANYPVTVNVLPSPAGTITGTALVCPGQTGVAYSVAAISGATSYSWVYSGTGFTPSGNTASITASFSPGATSGNLTVKGVNACGSGVVSANYAITINAIPGAAGAITGSATACQGQSGIAYSVTPISGATSYTWSYSGTGFTPSGNTSAITAVFSGSATSGNLTVRGTNSCGSGTISANFPITVTAGIGAAGTITGTSAVCTSGAGVYSVPPISGATSYIWTYSGTGFNPSGNGASITGTFSPTATSGILTVRGSGSCGTGAVSPNFPITVNVCPPHNMCNGCHINHTSPGAQLTLVGGNANLCMSCHNPTGVASTSPFADVMKAVPGVSGNSHSWNSLAVNAMYQTNLPTNPDMLLRVYSNEIVCSTCHNQHSTTYAPFLRASNSEDALCLNCHTARDVRRYADNPANKGTHPVGIAYTPGTDPRFTTTTFPLSATGKVVCSTCHDTHNSTSTDGNILRSASIDALCTNCHIEQSPRIKTTHEGMTCSVCHYAHETGSGNILLVRDNIVTPAFGPKQVIFTSNASAVNYADGSAPFNGVCEVCHTTAVDHYQSSSGGTSDARHLPSPQKCINCHPHDQGFAAQTDCFGCHNAITDKPGIGPAGGRRQIVDNNGNGTGTGGDFKRTSHHGLGAIPTVDDCLLCHYMGDHKKGVVKLLDPDLGYNSVITYDPANKASVENFCLNCHDANGVAGDLTPFSDNTAVPVVDKTMWLASAHKTKPYTCMDCHDNGHGSNKSTLLGPYTYAGPGTGTDLMNEEEGFCLTCHGAGGAATTQVHLAFSLYTNTATRFYKHDPAATYRKHTNGETGGAVFGGTNRHVECADCHNPHGAKSGTATAPALLPTMIGARGVEPTYAGAGAPTGFTWQNAVTQEYQVCYKCHSSYTTLPTYLPDGISNATTPTYVADGLKKLTSGGLNLQIADSRDMAKEYNPNNQSFHPVMAVGKNTGINATAFQTGYSSTSRIYCSSCHTNPNSATAGQGRGPHGSVTLHLLDKGINATIVNLPTSHGTVSNQNEVCSKCHKVASYYTGNTGSRFSYHQYHTTKSECYVCHDNHGSEQFHLFNFNRNSGGGNSCISSVSPNTQTAFAHAAGTATNTCTVTCHGTSHGGGKSYNPSYP